MSLAVVTGALSIGSAGARLLLADGWTLKARTKRRRPTGGEHIATAPLRFRVNRLLESAQRAAGALCLFAAGGAGRPLRRRPRQA